MKTALLRHADIVNKLLSLGSPLRCRTGLTRNDRAAPTEPFVNP
jgi:hypothetical protein